MAYGNEKEVGNAIKQSGVPRDQLFVTTKLPQTWHNPFDVEKALDTSLEALQLDYVDLYLMHFPHAYKVGPGNSTVRHENGKPMIDYELSRDYPSTWTAMEALVTKGKTRLIGVSNFNVLKLKRLLKTAKISPAVNQVEIHPYLPQIDLVEFCTKEGIHVMAHQPLGGKPVGVVNPNGNKPGPLLDLDIAEIARSKGGSPAQVVLSWAVQRNLSVIPKSNREGHMLENMNLIELSDEDMEKINHISKTKGDVRFLDPQNHIGFDIFNEEIDEPVFAIA